MAAGQVNRESSPADEFAVQDAGSSTTPLPSSPLPPRPPKISRNRRRKAAPPQLPSTSDQHAPSTADGSSQKNATTPKPQQSGPTSPATTTAQALGDKIHNISISVVTVAGDVCQGVLGLLGFTLTVFRTPVAFALSVYLLTWLSLRFLSSTERLLSPICDNFIAMNFIPLCQHINRNSNTHDAPASPVARYAELVELQSRLENVMDLAGDSSLSWAVRSSDVAMRDLTAQCRVSNLEMKDALVEKLEYYSVQAKDTSRLLQRLSSRVWGAVDAITAIDNYAVKTLEKIERAETLTGSGPFALVTHALRSAVTIRKSGREELARDFERSLELTAKHLERLITELEVALTSLDRLDAIQNTVNEIIALQKMGSEKDGIDLMAQLWTILGGNRREVALFKYHRELLAQMSTNRGFARDRVNAAIQQLTKLIEDLSELRDRAAHPVLVGADTVIPLEVHLESLRLGVNRLETFKHKTIDRENAHLQMLVAGGAPDDRRIDSS